MLRPYRERKDGELPDQNGDAKAGNSPLQTSGEARWRAEARRYEKPYVKAD